jgi:hypothetical protein
MSFQYQQIDGSTGVVDSFGKTFALGSKWGYQVADKLRQSIIALCGHRFQMGGSREVAVAGTAAVAAFDYDDYEPPYIGFFSTTFRAEMKTENAGTSILAILKDETAGTTLFTSGAVTATSWTRVNYTLASGELIAGHVYRAYFQKSNDDARAYGKAWMDRL